MTETIPCPKHDVQPAVPALNRVDRENGFTQCRRCWYIEWLTSVLGWR